MIKTAIAEALIVAFLLSSAVAAGETQVSRPEQTQEQSASGVTVKVSLEGKGDTITVRVALNTHTVNLDGYKFDDIVVLMAGGREYKGRVMTQEGSGHHRSAVVEFRDPGTKNVDIVIKDVSGVKKRTFAF